jgi:hypothetical protein
MAYGVGAEVLLLEVVEHVEEALCVGKWSELSRRIRVVVRSSDTVSIGLSSDGGELAEDAENLLVSAFEITGVEIAAAESGVGLRVE